MALITRLANLLRADLHAVLDRIEEPEALLRQALRDMSEALAEDQQRAACLGAECERIAARRRELATGIASASGEIERALAASREDLARATLRRRLEQEALDRVLERRARERAQEHAELLAGIEERALRLEAMRRKAELLARHAESGRDTGWESQSPAVREEDIELALLAERERRAAP
jgi:phage shock protein A